MGALLQLSFNFQVTECVSCGVPIPIPRNLYDKLHSTRDLFYCLHGHSQYFSGKTADQRKIEELERSLQSQRSSTEFYEKRLKQETKRGAAFRGQVTKLKNRVKNGVCPCCNRSFQNLHHHMQDKHPEWDTGK